MMWSAEKVFLFFAVFGGVVFAVRFSLYFLGAAADQGPDFSSGGGVSDTAADAFNIFNLHNVSAFCLIGGLVGYGCRQAGVSVLISSLLAAACGLLAVFILTKVFMLAGRLQSDGTVDLQQAKGQTAVVYLTVRPQTGGQVQVHIQERLMTLNAYTAGNEEIPTGALVRVEDVQGEQLIVRPIAQEKKEQERM